MAEILLNIAPQHQETSFWCWAAIASMLSNAFHSPRSQCQIAGVYLNKNCCSSPVSCYQSATLDEVLERFEFSFPETCIGREISYEGLKVEIGRNCPLAIRITDDDEFSHYVLLIGFSESDATKQVGYIDPRTGVIRFSDYGNLARAIQHGCRWSHTYFIHPLPGAFNL